MAYNYVKMSCTCFSLEFCTPISTEKVNKIGEAVLRVFITLPISVSYPRVIRFRWRISSGLPPVASVKQSEHL
ncbi:conserved hypothetical protein [Yersinia enterocolitica subsp. enterocolitica 8081]|uniref:Uncharacterized protein n=1 Tax=Yersinia enterocolitica serotype O:8 / biotype 1B (strain NCTC 13174 / 8081) TaxID=393305 RepID=A1JPE2_YERE8|nr:conserved hypothetical protein [Yersinia enterocolitica subsp. enterocolitica 8081]